MVIFRLLTLISCLLGCVSLTLSRELTHETTYGSIDPTRTISRSKKQNLRSTQVDDSFHLWPPNEIHSTIHQWAKLYPNLVHLTTAQDAFGLPVAGTQADCPYSHGCVNYILTIQDYIAHPPSSKSARYLPEVLWSGEVHGNERTGPTAVLEAVSLLLRAADCESQGEVAAAVACRRALADQGITHRQRLWLTRLVSTRRIVVVPTTNALGYFRNRREEGSVDPNRDFPYEIDDSKECMQTIAGRTINELYRTHLFQLSLTFHGGMEVVSYEWGAPHWGDALSPDHIGQEYIGAAYSYIGADFETSDNYDFGTMNSKVYAVTGGMEDWAYAGSWDTERVKPCTPQTFGGYDESKTTYNNATLRAFNMLVETSDHKTPFRNTLGRRWDVLNRNNRQGNGHISRNLRLALLAAELVQPYIVWRRVHGDESGMDLMLLEDIIPAREKQECPRIGISPQETQSSDLTVHWTVGGGLQINDTELWYANWDDVPELAKFCDSLILQPKSHDILERHMKKATMVTVANGVGAYTKLEETVFAAQVPIPSVKNMVAIVVAKVDQNFADVPESALPKNTPPQSHVVNARTNPNWYFEQESSMKDDGESYSSNGGSIIQGRQWYFSRPLTIERTSDDQYGPVVELSRRFDPSVEGDDPHVSNDEDPDHKGDPAPHEMHQSTNDMHQPTNDSTEVESKSLLEFMAALGLILAVLLVVWFVCGMSCRLCCRSRSSAVVHSALDQEEFESAAGGYTDDDDPEYGVQMEAMS